MCDYGIMTRSMQQKKNFLLTIYNSNLTFSPFYVLPSAFNASLHSCFPLVEQSWKSFSFCNAFDTSLSIMFLQLRPIQNVSLSMSKRAKSRTERDLVNMRGGVTAQEFDFWPKTSLQIKQYERVVLIRESVLNNSGSFFFSYSFPPSVARTCK